MAAAPTFRPEWHALSGWGESAHGWARVWRPRTTAETGAMLAQLRDEGRQLCLRGSGYSYGDASLFARGDVLHMTGLGRIRTFDHRDGTAVVESGVTIEKLWRASVSHGWWPPVVPGTMHPSMGGCVGMNVHGKNHYRVGGFGDHVEELELAQADGTVRTVHREKDADLFKAVVGGFGLLGIVTALRLRLKRIHSGELEVTGLAVPNLHSMIREFEARAPDADYLVGWVDCFDADGRGVLHAGRHLRSGEDPHPEITLRPVSQDVPGRILGVIPSGLVAPMMRPLARDRGIAMINAAKYRSAQLRGEHRFRQSHGAFAFLLDYVPGWKSIYEPGGLIQYQSFVPGEHAHTVHTALLAKCRERGIVPWLGVYKKHKPDDYLMSHTVDGFSLALDFPVTEENRSALWDLCHEMDDVVVGAGGRFYLAKDSTATAETFARAYPGLDRFRELKRELDPAGVLTSDQAVRVGLVDGPAQVMSDVTSS